MLQQLGLFTLVGAAGFLIDAGILLLLANVFGVNIYVARLLSWPAVATFTWLLNRTLTFRDRDTALLRQWLTFLAANTGGGLINICLSSALIAAHVAPIPAIACGSLAGLLWNFLSSRGFVFRRGAPGAAQAGPE
jgi:putative flippase GtrA